MLIRDDIFVFSLLHGRQIGLPGSPTAFETKWHRPTRNPQVGDIVVLQEANLIPTRWPLGKIVEVYPGSDRLVQSCEGQAPIWDLEAAYLQDWDSDTLRELNLNIVISTCVVVCCTSSFKTVWSWPVVCWCMHMHVLLSQSSFVFLYV